MPGQHIVWNMSKQNPHKQKESVNKIKTKPHILESNEITDRLVNENEIIESSNSSTSSGENIVASVDFDVLTLTKETKQKQTIDFKNEAKTQMERNNNLRITLDKDSGSGTSKRGWLIMILGLALFALGYIFYLSLGVFGLVLFWIFAVGGAIYFIIGLFMVALK